MMFTGLVEETGKVQSFEKGEKAWRLVLRAERVFEGIELGDSLAVNGCCLTVAALDREERTLEFDLLEETVRLTSFRILEPGLRVNLERSLLPTTRMGGHFVSGHIDGTGTVEVLEGRGSDVYLKIRYPEEFTSYVVYKGSIAIDGISLTVAEAEGDSVAVWLIPHTLEVTQLGERQVGDPVNLEFDLLAKYVEKQLQGRKF